MFTLYWISWRRIQENYIVTSSTGKAPSFPRPAHCVASGVCVDAYQSFTNTCLSRSDVTWWYRGTSPGSLSAFLERGLDILAEYVRQRTKNISVISCNNSIVDYLCGMSCMQNDSCVRFFLVWLQACDPCTLFLGNVQVAFLTSDIDPFVICLVSRLRGLPLFFLTRNL